MTEQEKLIRELEDRVDDLAYDFKINKANVGADIEAIKVSVQSLKDLTPTYVTITRYAPVEKLVFGFVGLVLIGVVTALVSLVVRSPA
jgi:hypothetical protein